MIAHNVNVPGGEIDLLAVDGTTRVVVEVRTVTGSYDPIDAIGEEKKRHVQDLGLRVGSSRVDFLGVGLTPTGFDVHWVVGD